MTELDCLPFTDLQLDPNCWEEAERNEKGVRVFFVLAGYRGTPSITVINHREKRKICFDKTITIRVMKNEVCFDKSKITHCP